MTIVHDHPIQKSDDIEWVTATEHAGFGAAEQPVLLAAAGMVALLSLFVGVAAAYLVFPEPTMWRIAVNGLVMALSIMPIRGLIRRASIGRAAA